MIFDSTDTYISTDELSMAVDAAVKLERPLLVKGEPGTGKTLLAEEIAKTLGLKLIQWHIKSSTKAINGLYEYDAVSRLRDSQLGERPVESSGLGASGRVLAQMPFAGHVGVVAGVPQQGGQSDGAVVEMLLVAGLAALVVRQQAV